jgi:hypothetical protein
MEHRGSIAISRQIPAGRQFTSGLFSNRLARATYIDPSWRKIRRRIATAIRRSREPDIGFVARVPEMRLQSSPALWRLLWSCQSGAMNASLPCLFVQLWPVN